MNLYLGRTGSGKPVKVQDAENPHVFASGRSGFGKTYLLRMLIAQAARQGAECLIFDYTSDFRGDTTLEGIPIERINVASPAFSINPLSTMTGHTATVRAQQLVELVRSVYRMGPRATTALVKAVLAYLNEENDEPSLNSLLTYAQEIERPGAGLIAALEPLELLNSLVHSGSAPISLDLASSGLIVLDFNQIISADLQKFLIELILRTLWDQRTSSQFADAPPLVLVLDECQNLLWGQSSMSVRILREGRKFNVGGWFASQWIRNENAAAALGQAAIRAYFRPDDQNIRRLAKHLCPTSGADLATVQKLVSSLKRGQFLQQNSSGRVTKITV